LFLTSGKIEAVHGGRWFRLRCTSGTTGGVEERRGRRLLNQKKALAI